jgi:hypothetical protein
MQPVDSARCSVLFFIAFSAYALIFSGLGNPNTLSRVGLTLSLVEGESVYIDDFAPLTMDKANLGDHFASDKAPGVSFLAVPATAVAVRLLRLRDPDARWVISGTVTSSLKWVMWIATLTTSSLYTAIAVVALFTIARLFGVSRQGALFSAIVYGFGTPTWGWATTFFSHATCGAFLVFGLWAVTVETTPKPVSSKTKTAIWGLAAGLLLGAAIVIEYTATFAVLLISIFGVWRSSQNTPERTRCAVASAIVGAVMAGLPLMLYNNMLFGSPFSISYTYSDFHEMQEGLWGIHWPDPRTAIKILFSGERGLFWLSPILVLTPMAWWSMWAARERALMVLCLAIFLAFWTINSGFFAWFGGASTGPRHITPSLPFLALPFAWLWDKSGFLLRKILVGMAVLSIIICFAMASIEVTAPVEAANTVTEILLPKLAKGNFPNLLLSKVGIDPLLIVALYVLGIGGALFVLWRATYSKDQDPKCQATT